MSAGTGHANFLSATAVMGRRSVLAVARQPTTWFPGLVFPLLIAAVNSAALSGATQLSEFPDVDSFLQFLLPATLVQGVLFGGIIGGADVASDIQEGFFDRLVASPVPRSAILVGRLAGAAMLGAVQAVIFIGVFLAFGSPLQAGVAGGLVLLLVSMVLAMAVGGFAAGMGLRTGSQEAVQNFFPLVFVLLFVSSAFFPTALMEGWYQSAAQYNPISWLINGLRALVVDGFAWGDVVQAFAVAIVLAMVTITFAAAQLRRRIRVA